MNIVMDLDRKDAHNAYTSFEGIQKGIEINGYSQEYSADYQPGYHFCGVDEDIELPGNVDAAVVKPGYFLNEPWFEYNPEDKLYYRFQYDDKQILSSDNLNRAYLQVVRNKGAEGVDGMKYTELKEHLVKNGGIIKEQLRTRKYKPQPVRRVEIPKPDGGIRNLGVPALLLQIQQQLDAVLSCYGWCQCWQGVQRPARLRQVRELPRIVLRPCQLHLDEPLLSYSYRSP